ncbi:MAG: tetratricopeptide repeat protein, partial [Pseudomonas stutzeri]|nr:tetratricopeptide repeat protein [Stutzerimonas stutzeri]NIM69612.1 tetratricopeptide repeat protein [Xanthomonadales bacterium]NIN81195.1 tetratricopeptide repeat protein [Stutzerimonas stutzeri]NIO13928.1 tetratricopeptide repeat protein [Xanthomonadales bacterium]NIP00444.1 tetratricopeptide repeat protein [Stutzerimonas stutzeri]
ASRPEAHVNLGDFASGTGDFEKALLHYEQALRMEPEFTLARVNMADALRQAGDDERGEVVLRDGLARNGDDAALRHTLGLLLVRTQRQDEGVAELRRAA